MCYVIITMPIVFADILSWCTDKNNWVYPLVIGVVPTILIGAFKRPLSHIWNKLLDKLKAYFDKERNKPFFWWLIVTVGLTVLIPIGTCVCDMINKQSLFVTLIKIMDFNVKLWVIVVLLLLLWLVIISIFDLVPRKKNDIFVKEYLPKINDLSKMLQLDKWDCFARLASQQKIQTSFLEIYDKAKKYKDEMIKTGNNKKIENDIVFIIDTFMCFIDIISEHSEEHNDVMIPIRFYKATRDEIRFEENRKLFKTWCDNCSKALNNYLYALNSLIKHIIPFSESLTEDYLKRKFSIDGSTGKLNKDVLRKNYEKNRIVEYASPDEDVLERNSSQPSQ